MERRYRFGRLAGTRLIKSQAAYLLLPGEGERNNLIMDYLFLLSLFVIAFLYSSVGHGGGTGYLALLAIYGIAPSFMKSTALTLNVFVSAIAFFNYYRAGFFRWKLIVPFLVSSIPFAYLGALTNVNPSTYKIILGVFLLLAIVRMLLVANAVTDKPVKMPFLPPLAIGATLGFFSGMIGIGGGIILSPVLILLHWANVKESAAASAAFIFLNSISGLFALTNGGFTFEPNMAEWIIAGIAGGIIGSYTGSFRLKPDKLKFLLASVLFLASIKLFIF